MASSFISGLQATNSECHGSVGRLKRQWGGGNFCGGEGCGAPLMMRYLKWEDGMKMSGGEEAQMKHGGQAARLLDTLSGVGAARKITVACPLLFFEPILDFEQEMTNAKHIVMLTPLIPGEVSAPAQAGIKSADYGFYTIVASNAYSADTYLDQIGLARMEAANDDDYANRRAA